MRLNAVPHAGERVAAEDLDFDAFEIGALAVTRHFLTSLDAPERQSWQTAFAIAVERFGPDIGLPLAYQVLKLVKALRRARSEFAYNDPLCPDARAWVTSDEAQLMRMLHHMRRDQTKDARDAVDVLTCGQMDPYVIRSGLALSARFGAGIQVQRQRPALRIVS